MYNTVPKLLIRGEFETGTQHIVHTHSAILDLYALRLRAPLLPSPYPLLPLRFSVLPLVQLRPDLLDMISLLPRLLAVLPCPLESQPAQAHVYFVFRIRAIPGHFPEEAAGVAFVEGGDYFGAAWEVSVCAGVE